ncbi:hypothetical protein KY289_016445 [Solanum tuberosum]|nr:hypothetical protein KY289_016445 [Solanum tuberosum]
MKDESSKKGRKGPLSRDFNFNNRILPPANKVEWARQRRQENTSSNFSISITCSNGLLIKQDLDQWGKDSSIQLVSHRENKIRSNDPNSLEDILRKGFSTGVSYMYSSLFEVFQWCNAVDFLVKKEEDDFNLLFRRTKWLTRNGKKHILFDL